MKQVNHIYPGSRFLMSRNSIRHFFVLILLSVHAFCVSADEGMWLPMFLAKYNEADMQSKGLKLSADDIYSVNHASLKDAVVQFGGGCTGELISGEGLLLTNHHCGRSRIQAHSTLEHNYINDGYWATSRDEELSNPGLTATFLIRMEDVTSEILKAVVPGMTETQRYAAIEKAIKQLEKKSVEGTHYEAKVKEFYSGNEYFMFITETFRDVRLVGAPPTSIGEFGGDTDNWMWPRHTGDFSVFRIYADSLNRPADYSPGNKPYKPKKFFEISLRELKEGDFTMVFGFPGRTQEYLTSYAVKQLAEEEDPLKILIREKRLAVMEKAMDADPQVKLNLTSKYGSISNYYKKFKGESRGLKRVNAIAQKQTQEKLFTAWVNADHERIKKYGNLLAEMENKYNEFSGYNKAVVLLNEAFYGTDFVNYINSYIKGLNLLTNDYKWGEVKKSFSQSMSVDFFKNYNKNMDYQIANQVFEIFNAEYPREFAFQSSSGVELNIPGLFENSLLLNSKKSIKFIKKLHKKFPDEKPAGEIREEVITYLKKDQAFKFVYDVTSYYQASIFPMYTLIDIRLDSLNRIYTQALREMKTDKLFYPDANSTLRLTYGKVEGYAPSDSVVYTPFTTIDGLMKKEIPGDKEFTVPQKLKDLYREKDFGQYAVNGTVPVCFLASNHTTGGNSGSPVLNAEGQLIGTNFDRNWEGTAADVMYDPSQARNISVDIRYTLFIIDKFAGANYLLDEMTIVK